MDVDTPPSYSGRPAWNALSRLPGELQMTAASDRVDDVPSNGSNGSCLLNDDGFCGLCKTDAIFDHITLDVMMARVKGALLFSMVAGIFSNLAAERLVRLCFYAVISNLPVNVKGGRNVGCSHREVKITLLGDVASSLPKCPTLSSIEVSGWRDLACDFHGVSRGSGTARRCTARGGRVAYGQPR